MRAGAGKRKGGAFERLVCKRLSLWVTGGARKDVFWRSALSGGRATVARNKGQSCESGAGDISAVAAEGNSFCALFCAECKHYRDLEIARIAFGALRPEGDFAAFWRQAVNQCRGSARQPFLVAKQNQQPALLATSAVGFRILAAGADYHEGWMPRLRVPETDMLVFNFEETLAVVDWGRVMAAQPQGAFKRVRI